MAKEYLLDPSVSPQSVCEDDPVKPCEISRDDDDEGMGNVMFEMEVIKIRLDAMKSPLDSQGEPFLSTISKLSNEVKLLQIGLEEDKFKTLYLKLKLNSFARKLT